jgi:hypothetical protein
MLAAVELLALPFGDVVNVCARDVQHVDHQGIQHARTAAADGAHRELLVSGNAELAHREDVERCSNSDSYLNMRSESRNVRGMYCWKSELRFFMICLPSAVFDALRADGSRRTRSCCHVASAIARRDWRKA